MDKNLVDRTTSSRAIEGAVKVAGTGNDLVVRGTA